jgi:site-specific DNA-methyltransferase (adenine-specific)
VSQLALLSATLPAPPAGIDLRCCDTAAMLATVRGARLIVADPPWRYESEGVRMGSPDAPSNLGAVPYPAMEIADIAAVVDSSFDCAAAGARLAMWCTFPMLGYWMGAFRGSRWAYKTGGAWGKVAGASGSCGVGYHWRGRAEILLIYVKGSPPINRAEHLSNHHVSPTTGHSEKPTDWLRTMLRAWTEPGDLVVDLFAGLGPVARACAAEGRRYVGAEIDPERHRMALERLAVFTSEGAP